VLKVERDPAFPDDEVPVPLIKTVERFGPGSTKLNLKSACDTLEKCPIRLI
jgi:hypothetical protein